MSDIQLCTVMPVPDDKFIAAATAAIRENPKNRPVRRLPLDIAPGALGPAEMAVLTAKRWAAHGRTLRVRFVGGHARVRERLVPFARQWEDHANIKLDFVGENDDAEIRVSFQEGAGSWSYLGTDALVIDRAQATMNYGWLTPEGPNDEYSRVVLHEFGHALSCVHEHEHPESGIPWDREKVYEYYELLGWSREMVDLNVLHRYDQTETNFSSYDSGSIMHYHVPNELTVGDFQVPWNRVLSDTDKAFIATIYPRDEKQPIELRTAQTVEAEIGAHGEEDLYSFEINRRGRRASVFTEGATNVVMSIYGPDDPSNLYAFDDDSGKDRNAQISRSFHNGRYLVRVTHFHPQGTGQYSIRLNLSP